MRILIHRVQRRITHPAARWWFRNNCRTHRGCVIRWVHNENGPSTVRSLDFGNLHWDANTRAYLTALPSLICVVDCWKLPAWPSDDLLHEWWTINGERWLSFCSLPDRAKNWLKHAKVHWPSSSPRWREQEATMSMAVQDTADREKCLIRDDKNYGKMWLVDSYELRHHLADTLLSSNEWSKSESDIPQEKQKIWGLGFRLMCIPTLGTSRNPQGH